MYSNALQSLHSYLHWYSVPRYTKEDRIRFSKDIKEYNSGMSLKEKIHICNTMLPDPLYEIVVRHDTEIYAFDTYKMYLYGDETEYPLEIIVNNIIHMRASS